jgi:hypothetical protein
MEVLSKCDCCLGEKSDRDAGPSRTGRRRLWFVRAPHEWPEASRNGAGSRRSGSKARTFSETETLAPIVAMAGAFLQIETPKSFFCPSPIDRRRPRLDPEKQLPPHPKLIQSSQNAPRPLFCCPPPEAGTQGTLGGNHQPPSLRRDVLPGSLIHVHPSERSLFH